MHFHRDLIRALCLTLSLYMVEIECGVDYCECWDRKFCTEYVFADHVSICECVTLSNARSGLFCTRTFFGNFVSNHHRSYILKYLNLALHI